MPSLARYRDLATFIREDFHKNTKRFFFEAFGLSVGLLNSIYLLLATPEPNMLLAYMMWNTCSICMLYGALSRGSTGAALLYSVYLLFDGPAMLKTAWLSWGGV